MYQFLLNMWIMGKIDEEYLKKRVAKNQINQEQYDMIVATPKLSSVQ